MPDILIRDVPDVVVAAMTRRRSRAGLFRTEYLRRAYDYVSTVLGGRARDPGYHVARISPWRVQLVRGADLASTIWQKP